MEKQTELEGILTLDKDEWKRRMQKELEKEAPENTVETVRWWIAILEATSYLDNLKVREMAEMLIDGIAPVPGTMEELVEYLYDAYGGDFSAEGVIDFLRQN